MSRKNDGEAVVVLTTTADDESARTLARSLVEERLAACVTRVPVRSTYRWEKICEDEEVLLVIKTARERASELERRVLELHPYECPELVVLTPEHVEASYLAWLIAASTPGRD